MIPSKRIALVGANGYVGNIFHERIYWDLHVLPLRMERKHTNTQEDIELFLDKNKIDILINAAGYTGKPNVDAAEDNKVRCFEDNVSLPLKLAEACKNKGVQFAHVSSGCIYKDFNSRIWKNNWLETHTPNFTGSWYSYTKAAAEDLLKKYPDTFIWRLRIPFEAKRSSRNYITKMINYPTLLIADNSMSHLTEFVKASLHTLVKQEPGTYNIVNGSMNTKEVVKLLQRYGYKKEVKYFESEEEFRKTVKTPRSNCTLDNSKINKIYKMTPIHEIMEKCIKGYHS